MPISKEKKTAPARKRLIEHKLSSHRNAYFIRINLVQVLDKSFGSNIQRPMVKNKREGKQRGTCISFAGDLSGCPPKSRVYIELTLEQHTNIKYQLKIL